MSMALLERLKADNASITGHVEAIAVTACESSSDFSNLKPLFIDIFNLSA